MLTPNAAPAADRPDFSALAIAPDGSQIYLTYDNFLQPWQSKTDTPRLMQGVVRTVDPVTGAAGALSRQQTGDARGSSQNGLTAEFLGDYNYAAATGSGVSVVFNDVRRAVDCPAIDKYRAAYVAAKQAGTALPTAPGSGHRLPCWIRQQRHLRVQLAPLTFGRGVPCLIGTGLPGRPPLSRRQGPTPCPCGATERRHAADGALRLR